MKIKILPKRKCYYTSGGQQREVDFNEAFFDELIKNHKYGNPPQIDRFHENKDTFGEVISLGKENDGLYAEIIFNKAGEEGIKNNEYKWLSPEIQPDVSSKDGKKRMRIVAISLLNNPVWGEDQKRLQSYFSQKKDKNVANENNIDYNLSMAMGKVLPNYDFYLRFSKGENQKMTLEEILEGIKNLKEEEKKKFKEILKEMMGEDTQEDEGMEEVPEEMGKEGEGEKKEVSMKMSKEMIASMVSKEIAKNLPTQMSNASKVNSILEEAIIMGKITPAQRPFYLKNLMSNQKETLAILKELPESLKMGKKYSNSMNLSKNSSFGDDKNKGSYEKRDVEINLDGYTEEEKALLLKKD